MCAERENDFIARLMQGEFNLYPMEFAPTLTLCDLTKMCTDLENKAEKYMRSAMQNDGDVFSRSDLYEYIIEAYKQGYRDANAFICYNGLCRDRMIVDEFEEESE